MAWLNARAFQSVARCLYSLSFCVTLPTTSKDETIQKVNTDTLDLEYYALRNGIVCIDSSNL